MVNMYINTVFSLDFFKKQLFHATLTLNCRVYNCRVYNKFRCKIHDNSSTKEEDGVNYCKALTFNVK